MKAPVFEAGALPDMGKTDDFFPRSRDSQLAVDPGEPGTRPSMTLTYTPRRVAQRGGGRLPITDCLKDFTSLDAMARMDGNSLADEQGPHRE